MTGITPNTAAKVIAGYFHTTATHIGSRYDSYVVRDDENRQWKIMYTMIFKRFKGYNY